MNAFDYLFENTHNLNKEFLVGNESITFRELYSSSVNMASYLQREIGIKKKVLLISANNLLFIKAYLAIIKSGNICVPLDPGIERSNFSYILDITNPDFAFITKDIDKKLPIGELRHLFPDSVSDSEVSGLPWGDDQENKDENECCEIIFTSGSTGKPKGVMISHRNIMANTASILAYLNIRSDDRMLVVLPFFYCYGLSLLHTHLRAGASIVLNNSFIFIGKVIKDLKELQCTGFAGVPSHYQILLRKSETFRKTSFPHLRYVTQAGGGLATVFIDEFRELFPEVKFYVMYGQTEATARLSYLPPELYEEKKGSIGRGIPGVELHIVNETGEMLQPGEMGELIAKGDNIMIGYYKDLSNSGSVIKDGWLYTGDLGFIDSDGFIFLNARRSDLIKIGGKRVSVKEIEMVILQLPHIIDCSLKRVTDVLTGESLIATIHTNSKQPEEYLRDEIKRHCAKHLALYKIPKTFIFDNDMKISASGKKVLKEGESNN